MKHILIQGTSLSVFVDLYKLVTGKKEDDKFSQEEADVITGTIESHPALGLGKYLGTTKKLANGVQKEEVKKFTVAFGNTLKTFGADIEPAEPVSQH